MPRIGIVTGAFEVDPTSRELLTRAAPVADAALIDPIDFRVEEGRFLAREEPLDEYDALIVRLLNPEGDAEFQYDFLWRLANMGVRVVNHPKALAVAESKFLSTVLLAEAGLPVPPTMVSQHTQEIMRFIEKFEDVVIKPLYGFQGHDVVRVRSTDDAVERVARLVGDNKVMLAQPYIPNPGRDIRAFVVGDEVIASIFRMAPRGEWKTNVSVGGEVVEHRLSSEVESLCVKAAKSAGLEYTGVDLIEGPEGPVILEVNGAPAWSGLEFATGVDIADAIVRLTLRTLEKNLRNDV